MLRWLNDNTKASRTTPSTRLVFDQDSQRWALRVAISAGATPKAVQRMLGHASAATTLDVYADLFEDDLDAVSDRIEEARARATVGDSWGKRA
jgi:hypothetical protein